VDWKPLVRAINLVNLEDAAVEGEKGVPRWIIVATAVVGLLGATFIAVANYYEIFKARAEAERAQGEVVPGEAAAKPEPKALLPSVPAAVAAAESLPVGSMYRGVTGLGKEDLEMVITKRDGAAFECELKWSIQGKLFRAAKGTGSAHNDRVEFVWHPVDVAFGTGGKDSWEHSGRFVDADTIEGRWSRRGGGLTGAFKLTRVR
jgi:hypothetical protein